jgi:MinD superfamily P-loop ATPase
MIRIAVASGKGGTGKTFISTNLWKTLTDENEDAILVDCDAEAPDAAIFFQKEVAETFSVTQKVPEINIDCCTFCGKCREYCTYNAIFILPEIRMIRVIEELCHGCGACLFACENGAIKEKDLSLGIVSTYVADGRNVLTEARMNAGVMSPVPVIKSAIKNCENMAAITILDSPPGTSCPFIHTVAASNYVILVTEPTPFGLSDLKQSVAIVMQMNKPFGVIINRAGVGDTKIYEWLKKNKINLLMEIPLDKEIARINSEGRLLINESSQYKRKFINLINGIKNQIN